MKVAFIHDHVFVEKNNQVYTTGGLPASVWDLYINDINQIKVFGRLGNRSTNILSSHKNVDFTFSKYYNHPIDHFLRGKKINKEIEGFLFLCDAAIIRLPSILGLRAIKICRKKNIPYAVEVVGNVYDALYNYGKIQGKLIANYFHKKNKKAILQAPYVIYVTKSYLQKNYPCSSYTACASDVQIEISEESLEKRLHKINDKQEDKIICLTIGNVNVKYKGYSTVLKAMKYLKNKFGIENIHYHIVGAGNFDEIEKEVKEFNLEVKVLHIGRKNREEIFKLLGEVDIYIHPSYVEGLPRSVIEAMSRACPCLTSNVGGIPELISEEFMHNPRDYKKLALDLKKMIESKEWQIKSAKQNFNKAKEYEKEKLLQIKTEFWQTFFNSIKL